MAVGKVLAYYSIDNIKFIFYFTLFYLNSILKSFDFITQDECIKFRQYFTTNIKYFFKLLSPAKILFILFFQIMYILNYGYIQRFYVQRSTFIFKISGCSKNVCVTNSTELYLVICSQI